MKRLTLAVFVVLAAAVAVATLRTADPAPAAAGAAGPLTAAAPPSAKVQARIAYLRQALPGNSLVPTDDPGEQARRDARDAAQDRVQAKIVAGAATEAEIHAFYAVQRAGVDDRIALARFILAEPQWSPEVHEKYQRVLDYAVGQRGRIDGRERDSLSLLASR